VSSTDAQGLTTDIAGLPALAGSHAGHTDWETMDQARVNLFADATEKFAALGATVVGVSHDDIATQIKFSKEECRDKFAVAADPESAIIKSYDAKMAMLPMSGRISYVISPDDKILYEYSSLDPSDHVKNTMKAVEDWRATHKQ